MIDKTNIAGTEGREPVGVVLSCGVKHAERGFPVEKEHFHLVVPREDNGRRPHHDSFKPFNTAASEKRRMVRGNIVHASRAECYEGHLRNQNGPKSIGAHPNKRPFCTGDGVHAVRWLGDEADNFAEIQCPHDRCEYRLSEPPTCKPFTRLLFQLRWQDGIALPSMLCKYTSGGWNTYCNIKGFFDYIEGAAKHLGIENYSLFGYPFTISLTQQTKPSARSRFPVSVITPDMSPIEFFSYQTERIQSLRGAKFEAITDQSQQAAALEYDDVKGLHLGDK